MIKLAEALEAWNTPGFEHALKEAIQKIGPERLPLQAGLSHSNHVSDSGISAVILNVTETANTLRVKTGIFYAGVNAGSCCADDPTPVCEQTEYCELQFDINKQTAEAAVTLLPG